MYPPPMAGRPHRHGFDGRACILKSMCEASKALTPDSGIVFKLFKLIFS